MQLADLGEHPSSADPNVTASGEEFCQEYCPIDPRDKMGAFDPGALATGIRCERHVRG